MGYGFVKIKGPSIMEMGKNIYCDLGFWNQLSRQFSTIHMSIDPLVRKKNQTIMDWYDLFTRSRLFFDCLMDDFLKIVENDEYLYNLWKSSTDGRGNLDFAQGSITQMCSGPSGMDLVKYNSLFLTDTNHNAEAANVGVLNICKDALFNSDLLFIDNGSAIQKRKSTKTMDWKDVLTSTKIPHNCNSMIIVDNYILKDPTSRNNLYDILKTLLPKHLDTVFYLTIFSLNETKDLEKKKVFLMNELKQSICPNTNVNVEIFECNKSEFHDRTIITNYMWIGIGAGFNLFDKNQSDKSTEIHAIYPMIVSEDRIKWSNERYLIFIDDAKKCLKNRNSHSNNRLLRD